MATTTAPTPTDGLRTLRPRQRAETAGARPEGAGEIERWLALLGGGGLALLGLKKGSLGGLGLAALGGCLAYCGATGKLNFLSALKDKMAGGGAVHVEESVSILKSPEELYRFWRTFENLPRFMKYLEAVQTTDGNRSHWVARGPLEVRVEWDAEITQDRPNELIAWRSLPGSTVDTVGEVRFRAAPAKRGTVVHVVMTYNPPGGKASDLLARLFGRSGEQEIREDLRRFKRLLETGEIPTTKGQPSGRGLDT